MATSSTHVSVPLPQLRFTLIIKDFRCPAYSKKLGTFICSFNKIFHRWFHPKHLVHKFSSHPELSSPSPFFYEVPHIYLYYHTYEYFPSYARNPYSFKVTTFTPFSIILIHSSHACHLQFLWKFCLFHAHFRNPCHLVIHPATAYFPEVTIPSSWIHHLHKFLVIFPLFYL